MSFAPWRSLLARSLHQNRHLPYARYFQLATVQTNGRPANRTVVFRGFLDNTDQLKTITDARSQKPEQIKHQSWGEVCWYFPETREQFRLAGQLTLVDADHPSQTLKAARQATWRDLSDASRLQFAWPHPGKVREDNSAFSPPSPNLEEPLPIFCLLLLEPLEVDHLELRGDPQNRCRYLYCPNGDTQWVEQAVNP